jgi:hypothetical protein
LADPEVPGFIPGATGFFEKKFHQKRGPLRFMRINEELLE